MIIKVMTALAVLSMFASVAAEEFHFTLPGRAFTIQTPPRNIVVDLGVREHLGQALRARQTQTDPPVVLPVQPPVTIQPTQPVQPPVTIQPTQPVQPPVQYIQPVQQPTWDPNMERMARMRQLIMLRYYVNSHFRVRHGLLGMGILPCRTYVPRRVTDPAVRNFYMWRDSQFASTQPVPQPMSIYGGGYGGGY